MAHEGTGFRTKILNSAKLSTLRFASEIGLRLVSTVVLTRLLAPEVYGVFAVVALYMYILEMLSDLGLRSLVLTKEGEVEDGFLQTCWTVSIIRGIVIFALSVLIAVSIYTLQGAGYFAEDSAYKSEQLPYAIAALGASNFLISFQSPLRYVYERRMEFVRATTVDIIRNVFALIVTITLAFYLRSIWALVIGGLARSTLHVLFSFAAFHGPPMRLNMSRPHLKLLIARGKWIIGHSALTALAGATDRLILGFVMSSTSFGLYSIARQLIDIIPQFLNSMDAQMGLQVFSHIQKSTSEDFKRNYYRYRLVFDAVAGLTTGGIIALAPLLVGIVFDDRYEGVGPIMQIVVLGVLLTGPLLLRSALGAERRFREMTILNAISAVVLLFGLSVGVFVLNSIEIALFVVALHRLPEAVIMTIAGSRRGWIKFSREVVAALFAVFGLGIGLLIERIWTFLV